MLKVTAGRRGYTAAGEVVSTKPVVTSDFCMGMSTQIVTKANNICLCLSLDSRLKPILLSSELVSSLIRDSVPRNQVAN